MILNRLLFNSVLQEILEDLGRTRLFQLTPVECRLPGAATPNPELQRHGGNLPAVVRYMQQHHADAWKATLKAMHGIVPGLTGIETAFTTNRRLTLLFHERGARAWSSDEVSDGTIQSLALFTCLFDPRVPLALIEEPENSVHPWIVKTFVDACRHATGKQLLVTTHSPALISYLTPSELAILWRTRDGRTHLAPLKDLDPHAPKLVGKSSESCAASPFHARSFHDARMAARGPDYFGSRATWICMNSLMAAGSASPSPSGCSEGRGRR